MIAGNFLSTFSILCTAQSNGICYNITILFGGCVMTILLFGVSNVGKSITGELLAHRLGYDFYDQTHK